jgi:hypothetical protein
MVRKTELRNNAGYPFWQNIGQICDYPAEAATRDDNFVLGYWMQFRKDVPSSLH